MIRSIHYLPVKGSAPKRRQTPSVLAGLFAGPAMLAMGLLPTTPALAAMVGDDVFVKQFFPAFGTVNGSNNKPTTVANGKSDEVNLGSLTININDDGANPLLSKIFFVNKFGSTKSYGGDASVLGDDPGNWFGVDGIDYHAGGVPDPSFEIVQVSVAADPTGTPFNNPITADRIRFDATSVFLDLSGTSAVDRARVVLDVLFGPAGSAETPGSGASAVPLPASVWLLLSGCLAAVGLGRNRTRGSS